MWFFIRLIERIRVILLRITRIIMPNPIPLVEFTIRTFRVLTSIGLSSNSPGALSCCRSSSSSFTPSSALVGVSSTLSLLIGGGKSLSYSNDSNNSSLEPRCAESSISSSNSMVSHQQPHQQHLPQLSRGISMGRTLSHR